MLIRDGFSKISSLKHLILTGNYLENLDMMHLACLLN